MGRVEVQYLRGTDPDTKVWFSTVLRLQRIMGSWCNVFQIRSVPTGSIDPEAGSGERNVLPSRWGPHRLVLRTGLNRDGVQRESRLSGVVLPFRFFWSPKVGGRTWLEYLTQTVRFFGTRDRDQDPVTVSLSRVPLSVRYSHFSRCLIYTLSHTS